MPRSALPNSAVRVRTPRIAMAARTPCGDHDRRVDGPRRDERFGDDRPVERVSEIADAELAPRRGGRRGAAGPEHRARGAEGRRVAGLVAPATDRLDRPGDAVTSLASGTPLMALEGDRRRFAAVSPHDDLRAKPPRLPVLGHVIGHVVERVAEARELRIDAVRGEHAHVDGREDRIAHAIAPREVPQLSGLVAGAPFAPRGAHRAAGGLAPEMDLERRSLGKHSEAKDVVRPPTRRADERHLGCDPERRKDHAQLPHRADASRNGRRAGHRFASDPPAMPRFDVAVRTPIVAALCLLPLGCGEGSATKVNGPPPDVAFAPHLDRRLDRTVGASSLQPLGNTVPTSTAASPTGAAIPAPLSAAPIGHLDGPDRLARLFQRLAGLDDGRVHDDVRILQFGDSHTASDMGTAAFRRQLQARFGDGGRGFVSIGQALEDVRARGPARRT